MHILLLRYLSGGVNTGFKSIADIKTEKNYTLLKARKRLGLFK